MDGFDDLLNTDASGSNPILDNPFEDPFARPRSPDPWTSFRQSAEEQPKPAAEYPHSSSTSLSPSSELSPSEQRQQSQLSIETTDPLDSKAANEDDEAGPELHRLPKRQLSDAGSSLHPSPITSPMAGTPAQPSKSLAPEPDPDPEQAPTPTPPTPLAHQASPPPSPSPEEPAKSATPPAARSPSPKLPTPPASQAPVSEVKPSSPLPPKPQPQPKQTQAREAVVSPLESGPTNGHSSFTTLALGGEMPGWQGSLAQSTFVNQRRLPSQDDLMEAGGWSEHGNGEGFVNGTSQTEESDDDDDDVPIARVQSATLAPTAERVQGSGIQPMFVITVGDPQKVGDPVRAFITYTVQTRTTSPLYRRSSFSVLRRYSDFLWLYETLSINNPGVIVPPVPEKQQYGRFQDTFVENRRAALNKCIQKIANHPSLRDDPDLKLFLESDSFVLDIKHRKAEIAHERGGLMATIGNTLVGPRFYETDEWFDNKKAYLDSLESQLRGLVKAIDLVSKQRNEVALSMAEFAENIAGLSACDMGKQLSQTLGVLSEVQRKAKELQDLQAREDVSTVMSTVDEYARLVNSVRLAFSSRVRLYAAWQNADGDVRKAQQAHEKARKQGRIPADRLGGSLSEIAEAERRAMEAKQDFDNASKMIKSELARFEQERVEDFKDALMAFLDGMISKQKEIIQSWESYQEFLLKRMGTNLNSNPNTPPSQGSVSS